MGIGSFLAGAGQIGATAEDFVNKREVQRAQRAEAQARQLELARTEKLRQGVIAMPDLSAEGPMYNLGAPGAVEDVGVRRPAGITPVGTGTGAAPPVSVKPPAPTGAPKRMFAGVEVPYYNKNAPERLGIDPNASDFARSRGQSSARAAVGNRLSNIANDVFGRTGASKKALFTSFLPQNEKADVELRKRASDWYTGKNAVEYFIRNPEMEAVAAKDPIGFFKTVMTPPPARGAAPQTAKAAAKTPATQTATEDLKQYANVPWSAVRDRVANIESVGYDTLAYDRGNRNLAGVRAPQPVTTMTIGQVLNFQRNQMRAATKGFRGSGDVGSTGVGRYQFESDTLEENAKKAFGKDYQNVQFTAANQEVLAETLWNAVRGSPQRLAKTWGAFGGKEAGQTQTQSTGVQQVASASQDRIDPSNFYLSNPTAISRDTSNAIQARQELTQMANLYRQSGMVGEFTQTRAALREADNNIRMLQGMQGITEMAMANDPRRLAAVWSDYAGTPIQIQPRTDGTFNIIVNGKVAQQGVDRSSLVDTARSTFDRAYLQQRIETQSAVTMESLKSRLRVDEETAKGLMQAAREIEIARINGDYNLAKQKIANLEEKIFATPGGDTYLRSGGTWQQLVANYRAPGLPEDVPAGPAAVPIAGLTPRVVGFGTGG
jgi:hypothetical protein